VINSPFSLDGKRILITGVTGGIGQEIAAVLSSLGAFLILNGRDAAKLNALQEFIQTENCQLEAFDLEDVEAIPSWMADLASRMGPLWGVVHCAGISDVFPIRLMKWGNAERIMKLNWGTSWALAKGFSQKSVHEAGDSRIVFISSSSGLVGVSGMSAYSSSKGAVIALTRSLCSELSSLGIRVNSVAPGFIKTQMNKKYLNSITVEQTQALEKQHPLGFGEPSDVAFSVAFLLSNEARWISGVTLPVDGGLTAI